MLMGEVVFYVKAKGWGFIRKLGTDPESDYFFHVKSVQNRIGLLIGDLVSFEAIDSPIKPGRQDAVDVRLLKRDSQPAPAQEVSQ
jgi:cold shock CspA family protein